MAERAQGNYHAQSGAESQSSNVACLTHLETEVHHLDIALTVLSPFYPVFTPPDNSETMGLSVSRLLSGLFGKKEMRKSPHR